VKLSILGWSTNGLRCPDVDLDFAKGGKTPHAVTLLQMPNGTGKTTTLELIRAALDGSAAQWNADRVRSFRRALSDDLHGEFCIRLAVDQEPLTFTLKLDFDAGRASYTTQFRSRNVEHHEPPAQATRFLRSEFVKLFIFDGEYAHVLFDGSKSEAGKAIKNLFQLYLFEDLQDASDAHLKEKIKEIGSKSRSANAIKIMRKDLEAAENHLRSLKKEKDKASAAVSKDQDRIEILDSRLRDLTAKSKGLNDNRARALSDQAKAQQEARDALYNLLTQLRKPIFVHPCFHQTLSELVAGLEQLRLPADTASQWFDELADAKNDNCVCGRPLGPQERQNILTLKDRFLGTEVHAVLNAVKGSARQALLDHAQQPTGAETSLAAAISTTSKSEKHKRECDTKLKAAEQALAERGNADEQRINSEILDLRPKVADYKELLMQMQLPTGRHSLKVAEARQDELALGLSKSTKTVELNEKIKVLRGILEDASEIADAALRNDVKDKCNERLAQVLKNDPLRIGSIERSIALESQGGASMGQTLAVGYTFLVTLLSEGNHSFPLVVDSPAGPLDHTIRREVARIIPAMSDQFLAFTISTEREGFVSTLADAVEEAGRDSVQFLTLVRLTAGTRPLVANAPPGRIVKTANSALVDDREFFESFNLEADEDEV